MVCVTGAVARQITSDLNKELLLTPQKKLATDGNSDEDYKCFPILVRHVDKDSELIITRSLLVTSHVCQLLKVVQNSTANVCVQ